MTTARPGAASRDAALLIGRAGGIDLVRPLMPDAGVDVVVSVAVEGQIMLAEVARDATVAWVVSDVDGAGMLWTLDLREGVALAGAPVATGGGLPCAIAVDPRRERLVVANYGGEGPVAGSLSSFVLDDTGFPTRTGGWADPPRSQPPTERHVVSHPHHVEFVEGALRLIDMGNDRVVWFPQEWSFDGPVFLDLDRGCGPRWAVTLGSDAVIAGEIDSVLIRVGDGMPGSLGRSTVIPGAASEGYDFSEVVALGLDRVIVAARGTSQLLVVDVSREHSARIVQTVSLPAQWPGSISLAGDVLYVACRDSSHVFGYGVRDRLLAPSPQLTVRVEAPIIVRAIPHPDLAAA